MRAPKTLALSLLLTLALGPELVLETRAQEAVAPLDYYPLSAGHEWRYESEKTNSIQLPQGEMVQEISITSTKHSLGVRTEERFGRPLHVAVEESTQTSHSDGATRTTRTESHLSADGDAILVHGQRHDDDWALFSQPAAILKLPVPKEGEPYPSRFESRGLTIDARPHASSRETVEVPAGRFENCLRIDARGPVTGKLQAPGNPPVERGWIELTLWFARGVGIVKESQRVELTVAFSDRPVEIHETEETRLVAHVPPKGGR